MYDPVRALIRALITQTVRDAFGHDERRAEEAYTWLCSATGRWLREYAFTSTEFVKLTRQIAHDGRRLRFKYET